MEKVSITGIVYLVQPAELVSTNRFKVGCSSKNTLERLQKGYRKGTRYLHVCECENPFTFEKQIKNKFNTLFKLIAGTEYFEGDESNMKECFIKEFQLYQLSLTSNSKKNTHGMAIVESDAKESAVVESDTKESAVVESDEKDSGVLELEPNESTNKIIRLSSLLKNSDDNNVNTYVDLFMFRAFKVEINPLITATKINIDDSAEYGEYIVDCESNFNHEQINIIIENNIFDIEDIIRSDKIDKISKQKSLECYKYVKVKYELTGIEPFNGHTIIRINDLVYEIRINNSGFITFIQPMRSDFDWNNYHTIRMS